MASPRRWLVVAGGLLLAAAAGWGADETTAPKMPRVDEPKAAAEEPKGAAAGTVVITSKEYQDLIDELARLKSLAKGDKADAARERPEPPSGCKVAGEVVGDNVHLRLEFEFRTRPPRARVLLGCAQGYPSKADLDGRPPLLRWGSGPERQLLVQVEEPGDHRLRLEMDLPLTTREGKPGERGFELDLPAAAVTTLEGLALPAGVTLARAEYTLRDAPAGEPKVVAELKADGAGALRTRGLGPVERLELTWEERAPSSGAPPLPTLEAGRVEVVIDEKYVTTRARLTLGAKRGLLRQWQLLLPPRAEVTLPDGDERAPTLKEEPVEPKGSVRTLTLSRPTKDPLTVTVVVQQPRGDAAVPVGPFVVADAVPQRGDIVVYPPPDATVSADVSRGSQYVVTPRALTDEEKRGPQEPLAFRYGVRAAPGKVAAPPFLELSVRKAKAVVEARVSHALRLTPGEADGATAWRVATTVDATAHNAEVETLLFQFPPDFEFDARVGLMPAGQAQGPEWVDRDKGLAQVTLTPRRKGKIVLTFEGRYGPLAPGDLEASLKLPHPLNVENRGGSVAVVVPDDLELVAPRPGMPWAPGGKPEGHARRTWPQLDAWPTRFDVAWQPYRPDVAVDARAFVTISGRQASVRHELWFASTPPPAGPLLLHVPDEVHNFAAFTGGDRLAAEARKGGRAVAFTTPPDRDHPLTLEYAFRVPESGAVRVPLAVPEQATRGETRLYVLTDPGVRAELAEGRWEQRQEEVKGVARYPSLILLARRPDAPLTLRLPEAAGEALAAWRVERALVQATVADSGQQTYRVRYLLGQVAAAFVDVEVPAPPAGNLRVVYRGKEAPWQALDEPGRPSPTRRTVRVTLEPGPQGAPGGVLEVGYVLSPGRTASSSALHSTLQPPLIRNDAGVAPARWQVTLPPSWVALTHDGGQGAEYQWVRRGWLFVPLPAAGSADLERWFAGPDGARGDEADAPAALVCWAAPGESLRLTHAPQQWWLLLCSLALLGPGLALGLLTLPRGVVWSAGVLAAAGVVLCGLFLPGLLAAVLYGCQPGVAVLVPLLGAQWLLQQRYRRQVVFLPGFARSKGAAGAGARPRTEPSTVDALPPGSAPRPASPSSEARRQQPEAPRPGSSVTRKTV